MPPPGHGDRSSDSWGWVAPGGGEAPKPSPSPRGSASSLEPLSRRLLQIAGVLSCILILLVGYTWSRGEGESSLNPIAEAAERTQGTSGARSEIRAVYSIPGATRSISMHGQALYNGATGRSRVMLTVPTPNGEVTMEGVGDDRTTYLRSKLLQAGLPPGDEWMAIESGLGRSSETSFASSSGPDFQLELLRAVSGEVETIGEETVDGVETTRYRGSFDLPEYARFLREEGSEAAARKYDRLAKAMPSSTEVEAWVDGDELVRRVRTAMDFKLPRTGLINSMDMTEDFSDFGISPEIALPDPATVFDATPIALAELGLLDGSNEMPALAPTGSPLSPEDFNARAQGVCVDVEHRLEGLGERGRPLVKAMKEAIERDGFTRSSLEATRAAIGGFYEPSAQAFAQGLSQLARISPPAGKAADFHRLLRISSLQIEILTAENRTLEAGDYSLAKDLSDRLERLGDRADRLSDELGLEECGSDSSSPGTSNASAS